MESGKCLATQSSCIVFDKTDSNTPLTIDSCSIQKKNKVPQYSYSWLNRIGESNLEKNKTGVLHYESLFLYFLKKIRSLCQLQNNQMTLV